MTGRTVLVAGGAGYIGSHVAKALAARGDTPVVVDSLTTGHRWAVRWGPLECGNVGDSTFLEGVFARHRPSAVVHLAAFIEAGESVRDPARYYGNNIPATLALASIAARRGVPLVYSSTAAVYGAPAGSPVAEEAPLAPISPYGVTKLVGERILGDLGAAGGLRWMTLRYFNAAGADPEGEIGEWHDPETHLVPSVLLAANGTRPVLEVYGRHYATPDGTCVRDYVHVSDLARAHIAALDHLERGGDSLALNVGTGVGASILRVIETTRLVTGRVVRAVERPPRPGDAPTLIADCTRIRNVLGWRAELSDLETIIETAWRWIDEGHQRRLAGARP